MHNQFSKTPSKLDKAMTTEQFNQIVDAILAGKYSWACVLILRFAGYNPLHYIPYRTYNRLIKDNCCSGNVSDSEVHLRATHLDKKLLSRSSNQIQRMQDLNHQDLASSQDLQIKGGQMEWGWF